MPWDCTTMPMLVGTCALWPISGPQAVVQSPDRLRQPEDSEQQGAKLPVDMQPTMRTVESWRWVVANWLALAGFQLRSWWLEAAEEPGGHWRFGAAVRIPFGEGDEAMLQYALEQHADAPRFRMQRDRRRASTRDMATQLGEATPEGGRPSWNPLFRPDTVHEPRKPSQERDFSRPYRNMGVVEFQRRLANMLAREGAHVCAWQSREPDFMLRTTMLTFFVAVPYGSEEAWRAEGGGMSREAYV